VPPLGVEGCACTTMASSCHLMALWASRPAIGNIKYGAQSGLFKQMTTSDKPLCLDFRDAFALARKLV